MPDKTGYRLALVAYLNTYPFSEGFRISGIDELLDIQHVTPAECARLYKEGKVDISLCPVGALDDLPAYEVGGKYCIGADGEVGTVVLLSNVPLDQIRTVRLDTHGRTSNLLLQVLAKHHWKKEWSYYADENASLPESCLMIGDKVFEHKKHFTYSYDLAAAWKEMSGLPMVFAVWIMRPDIAPEVMHSIDRAFELGMACVDDDQSALEDWQKDYLINYISYPLDAGKLKALQLFRSLAH